MAHITNGSRPQIREETGRFASTDPRTGEVIDYHPICDEAAVRAAVARAQEAAAWWDCVVPNPTSSARSIVTLPRSEAEPFRL